MRWKCSARSTHSSDLSPIVVPQIMRWSSPRKLVNGECVAPSAASVEAGSYLLLARPIFIYVRADTLDERPEVEAFVKFYLEQAPELVTAVGYVPLPAEAYAWGLDRLENRITGSVFKDVAAGTPINEVLERTQ